MMMTKIGIRAIAYGSEHAAIYTSVGNVVHLVGLVPLALAQDKGVEIEPASALITPDKPTLVEQPAPPKEAE